MPTRLSQNCREWLIAVAIAAPFIAIRILADRLGDWTSWVYLAFYFVAVVAVAGVVVARTILRQIDDAPCSDSERLERFRRKMRKGPVGYWNTQFGVREEEIVRGEAIEFGSDGAGRFFAWGGDEPLEFDFEWRSIGDFRIEVRGPDDDDWRTVTFDLEVRRNENDIVEIQLIEPGADGFLWSRSPLTLSYPIPGEQY